MTATTPPERGGQQPGGAERLAGPTVNRRGELEALAFLVGLFGTLMVLVVTIGSASPH